MVDIQSSLLTRRGPASLDADAIRHPGRAASQPNLPSALRPERSHADLARMIEGEIIPRLMLSHRTAHRPAPAAAAGSVGPRTLEAFARMALASEAPTLTAYAEALIQGGLSLEEIYVDLLIPTARRLGDDWVEDVISFTDVTIGLARLQQVVRALGHTLPARDPAPDARSVYLAPAPGEQHAFGLVIIEDYFRRAGWRTRLDTATTTAEAARTVGGDWFDVFGLSATSDAAPEEIASTIALVRRTSMNPRMFVMVGGRLFLEDPRLADAVGADATSETAADALCVAEDAISARAFA